MEGLVKEGSEMAAAQGDTAVSIPALSAPRSASSIMKWPVTAPPFAGLRLGEEEAAELLQQTLDEEVEADDLLTQIAENLVPVAH